MGRRKDSRNESGAKRAPGFGVAVLTPVLLAGVVAGAPDRPATSTPVASAPAAAPAPQAAPPDVAPRPLAAPPAGLHIPAKAMAAYRKAQQIMATADPDCGVTWNLLAGIGRIESAAVGGTTAVRAVHSRSTAPTNFATATWSRFASDGDGDGAFDAKNPFDATLATARHLCSGGTDFRNQSKTLKALLRYNDSMAFAANVLGWAAAYATGTAPLNLPPIYGAVPVLGPYLPGVWGLSQATLVLGIGTQAGYLLPKPAAGLADTALLSESEITTLVAAVPEPAAAVEIPDTLVSADPMPAAALAARSVAPQMALQGDGPRAEPAAAFDAPTPAAVAPQPVAPQPVDLQPAAPQSAPPVAPEPVAPAPVAPAPVAPEPVAPEPVAFELPAPEPVVQASVGRAAGRGAAVDPVVAAPSAPAVSAGDDSGGSTRSGSARRGGRGDG